MEPRTAILKVIISDDSNPPHFQLKETTKVVEVRYLYLNGAKTMMFLNYPDGNTVELKRVD